MNQNSLLEESIDPDFQYERLSFESKELAKSVHIGFVRPKGLKKEEIKSSFYLFHGGNGDDKQSLEAGMFQGFDPLLLDKMKEQNVQFVLPFIGTSCLVDSEKNSWYRYFLNEVLPFSETNTKQTQSRWISGFSMGGTAALQVFLKNLDLFHGVGAHFPCGAAIPFDSESGISEYVSQTGAVRDYVNMIIPLYKENFGSMHNAKNYDAFFLLDEANLDLLREKSIYFDVGTKDEFGLLKYGNQVHDKLKNLDVRHFFESVEEGHHNEEFLKNRFSKQLNYLWG